MALAGRRILVTGGAGFIGSHLVARLAPGNRVTVADDGRRDALRYLTLPSGVEVRRVVADIRDWPAVRRLVGEAELVLHLAAIAGVSSYSTIPVQTMEVNMLGTAHVLRAAHEAGVLRVLNFATSELYGPMAYRAREDGATTQGPPGELRWTYSVSKLAGEHLALAYHRERGLPVTSLRPFNVYGPRQVGEGAIQIFVRQALEGRPLTVHGDGDQIRAWCHVDDLVEATLRALECPDAVGRCFNIGNPRAAVSALDLAQRIVALSGASSKIEHAPGPAQAVLVRVPAIEEARRVLQWEPRVDLEEGLRQTIEWYRREAA